MKAGSRLLFVVVGFEPRCLGPPRVRQAHRPPESHTPSSSHKSKRQTNTLASDKNYHNNNNNASNTMMRSVSFLAVIVGILGISTMTCHAADSLRGVKDTDTVVTAIDTGNAILNIHTNAFDNHGRFLVENTVVASVIATCDVG